MTPVLRARQGLSESDLRAITDLQQRVVEVDGGRLKLEWQTLWTRPADQVNDFCLVDGVDGDGRERAVGFLGIYSHGDTPELAGMVDPQHRRRGHGTALLGAARAELAARGVPEALLVCPRSGAGGSAFAQAHGGVAAHSEYALELRGEPTAGRSDPSTSLRPGTSADADRIRSVLRSGFSFDDPSIGDRIDHEENHVVVVHDDQVIGYLRLTFDDGGRDSVPTGGVYGFAIDPDFRGRGVGRDVLRRCCRDLMGRGAQGIGLEVATDNEQALGLYTSLGFEPLTTEDYFRIGGTATG